MWQDQLKKLSMPLAIGGISVFLIVISVILLIKSVQSSTPITFSSDTASESAVLVVDVQGAVARPGVYELAEGSRVEDALSAAGGLTNEADAERISQTINRAAKLSDGAKLYFPSHNISNPSLTSVNAASQSDLEELPGIGPVTAKKIITGRPWQTLDALVAKKAMSQSLFNKLKDQLSL